jgi:hypothetical protein
VLGRLVSAVNVFPSFGQGTTNDCIPAAEQELKIAIPIDISLAKF